MADPAVGPDEFRCGVCGGVFTKAWSDEESLAEHRETFGEPPPPEDRAHICDECYPRFLTWAKRQGLTL